MDFLIFLDYKREVSYNTHCILKYSYRFTWRGLSQK